MQLLNRIRPVYLYLASGLFLLISKAIENGEPLVFNLFLGLGLSTFILAVIKYFQK